MRGSNSRFFAGTLVGAVVGVAAGWLLPPHGADSAGGRSVASAGATAPGCLCPKVERSAALQEKPRTFQKPDTAKQQLLGLRSQLKSLRTQKDDLLRQLQKVEAELQESEEAPPYEFAVTPEEWQALATHSFIKYRVPCPLRPGSNWRISESLANAHGWSPQDTETIMDAFRRSNERLWAAVQPRCFEILQNEVASERLGFAGCQQLIEAAATEEDPLAIRNAKRMTGEVRGGLREPPSAEESSSGLFELYMALTGEGDRFESDLAEDFGPEAAQRIWHSFPCTNHSGGRPPARR